MKLISRLLATSAFVLFVNVPLSFAQTNALRVGVITGIGGLAAKWNRFQNMGITLAQEELRSRGITVELVFEDSQTLGTKAVSSYRKLSELDNVDAILADDFGFVIAPLLPLVKRDKRFLLALSLPHAEYCAQAGGYFYSISSQFADSRPAFEQFFDLHPAVKRIAVIVFDDPEWGNTYRGIWTAIAKQRGLEIVETVVTNEWQPDFKSILTRILPKKPDAFLLAHEPETFTKAIRQMSFSGPVVSANNIFEMLSEQPRRTEIDGFFVVDPAISQEFRDRFTARFGVAPILEAYAGYEALHVVVKAFQKDRTHPEQGIKKVFYRGVAGTIDFRGPSCSGNKADWALFKFQGGQPVAVSSP